MQSTARARSAFPMRWPIWASTRPRVGCSMSSLFRSAAAVLAFSMCGIAAPRLLRVCADPNNLPFSNQRQQGFENRIAELLARDLGAKLEYTWWAERKSFLKNSLD